MNGLLFYIGLGAGLAAACGLRPFLPVLLAGALASGGTLGVDFAHGSFHFLRTGWWLLVVAVALALAYALQLLLRLAPIIDPRRAQLAPRPARGREHRPRARRRRAAVRRHARRPRRRAWPGLLGGLLVAALAQRAVWPVIAARPRAPHRPRRARGADRLPRRRLAGGGGARRAAAPARLRAHRALAWFGWRGRARGDEKYAGLRILRR